MVRLPAGIAIPATAVTVMVEAIVIRIAAAQTGRVWIATRTVIVLAHSMGRIVDRLVLTLIAAQSIGHLAATVAMIAVMLIAGLTVVLPVRREDSPIVDRTADHRMVGIAGLQARRERLVDPTVDLLAHLEDTPIVGPIADHLAPTWDRAAVRVLAPTGTVALLTRRAPIAGQTVDLLVHREDMLTVARTAGHPAPTVVLTAAHLARRDPMPIMVLTVVHLVPTGVLTVVHLARREHAPIEAASAVLLVTAAPTAVRLVRAERIVAMMMTSAASVGRPIVAIAGP
jgi:hypothetical protein